MLAQDGCRMEYKGRILELSNPEFRQSPPGEQPLPRPVQWILQLLDVNDFLLFNYKEAISWQASSVKSYPKR